MDTAMTLVTTVTSKRCFQSEDYSQPPEMMYYLNDGIYGSFVLAKLGHVEVEPIPLDMGTGMPITERPLYSTTLWGPTCDSLDYIKKGILLPEMHIGEWIYFKNMGAYTKSGGTEFNGFGVPKLLYHVSELAQKMLELMPNRDRMIEIMGTDTINFKTDS